MDWFVKLKISGCRLVWMQEVESNHRNEFMRLVGPPGLPAIKLHYHGWLGWCKEPVACHTTVRLSAGRR